MKTKICMVLGLMVICAATAFAQEPKLPKKVSDVKVENLDEQLVSIPHFGEKNLIIFYMDPDRFMQNDAFTKEFEAQNKGKGDNLFSFGIVNKYDSALPIKWIRSGASKRTANNGGVALIDKSGDFQKKWGLGDCNNFFVLLVVSKEGELVYCHKGELSRSEIDDFYKFIEAYK